MWVAYPFSRGSFQPRNWTGVSCIVGGFFTNWAIKEAQISGRCMQIPALGKVGIFIGMWFIIENFDLSSVSLVSQAE